MEIQKFMDSTMEWDEFKNLSVRIAVETGTNESLVGTGVLYRRGFKEPALILTAAHVLADAKENLEQEKQYYFDCADSEGKDRRIVCSLKMGEKIHKNSRYIINIFFCVYICKFDYTKLFG